MDARTIHNIYLSTKHGHRLRGTCVRTDGRRDLLPFQRLDVPAGAVHEGVGQGGEDAGVAEGGADGLHGLLLLVVVGFFLGGGGESVVGE